MELQLAILSPELALQPIGVINFSTGCMFVAEPMFQSCCDLMFGLVFQRSAANVNSIIVFLVIFSYDQNLTILPFCDLLSWAGAPLSSIILYSIYLSPYPVSLFSFFPAAREKTKETKKQEAEEKKRKSQESAEAKKAARKAATRRKKKRTDDGDGEDGSSDLDDDDDEGKRKGRKSTGKAPRTRGNFEDTDPAILRRGANLDASYRLGSFSCIKEFVNEIWEEKPALLRCKKGSVKKILTKSLQKSTLENRKEYIVQTSKSFGVAQSKMSSALKKLSGEPVRQNNTVAQDEDTAVMLGMDLLMKAKQKQAALEGDRRWIMDRKKLMEKLEKTLNLCCTLLLF